MFLRKYKKTTTNNKRIVCFSKTSLTKIVILQPNYSRKCVRNGSIILSCLFSKRKGIAHRPSRTHFTEDGERPKAY